MRVVAVVVFVLACAGFSGCRSTKQPPSTVSLERAIEFQDDEPAPSISQVGQKVVVVVRVINRDTTAHRFTARATLHAQDGSEIGEAGTPVSLSGGDGRLVRIDVANPRQQAVWSVSFAPR